MKEYKADMCGNKYFHVIYESGFNKREIKYSLVSNTFDHRIYRNVL